MSSLSSKFYLIESKKPASKKIFLASLYFDMLHDFCEGGGIIGNMEWDFNMFLDLFTNVFGKDGTEGIIEILTEIGKSNTLKRGDSIQVDPETRYITTTVTHIDKKGGLLEHAKNILYKKIGKYLYSYRPALDPLKKTRIKPSVEVHGDILFDQVPNTATPFANAITLAYVLRKHRRKGQQMFQYPKIRIIENAIKSTRALAPLQNAILSKTWGHVTSGWPNIETLHSLAGQYNLAASTLPSFKESGIFTDFEYKFFNETQSNIFVKLKQSKNKENYKYKNLKEDIKLSVGGPSTRSKPIQSQQSIHSSYIQETVFKNKEKNELFRNIIKDIDSNKTNGDLIMIKKNRLKLLSNIESLFINENGFIFKRRLHLKNKKDEKMKEVEKLTKQINKTTTKQKKKSKEQIEQIEKQLKNINEYISSIKKYIEDMKNKYKKSKSTPNLEFDLIFPCPTTNISKPLPLNQLKSITRGENRELLQLLIYNLFKLLYSNRPSGGYIDGYGTGLERYFNEILKFIYHIYFPEYPTLDNPSRLHQLVIFDTLDKLISVEKTKHPVDIYIAIKNINKKFINISSDSSDSKNSVKEISKTCRLLLVDKLTSNKQKITKEIEDLYKIKSKKNMNTNSKEKKEPRSPIIKTPGTQSALHDVFFKKFKDDDDLKIKLFGNLLLKTLGDLNQIAYTKFLNMINNKKQNQSTYFLSFDKLAIIVALSLDTNVIYTGESKKIETNYEHTTLSNSKPGFAVIGPYNENNLIGSPVLGHNTRSNNVSNGSKQSYRMSTNMNVTPNQTPTSKGGENPVGSATQPSGFIMPVQLFSQNNHS
jgi:hypothetical protein